MNEKIEKVKTFASEHKHEIVAGFTFVSGALFGYVFGQASMIPLRDEIMGQGVQATIELIRANGLEATEEFIRTAYKIK